MLSEYSVALGDAVRGVGFGLTGPSTFGAGVEPITWMYTAGIAGFVLYFVFR